MDYRKELLEKLGLIIMAGGEPDYIYNKMVVVLGDYEIAKRTTEIAVQDDKNERLLKRYVSCMLLDGKSEKTIKVYLCILRNFAGGIPDLTKTTANDVRLYLATLKTSNNALSNRSLDNYRKYISAFFKWMEIEGYIDKSPCEAVKPIKYKDKIRKPFTMTETDKMRTACKNVKERAILEFLLTSGARLEETVNMNIDDIDFASNSVHIRKGKGNKERYTYITDVASMHIKQYIATRSDGNEALFAHGGDRYSVRGLEQFIDRLAERANITDCHPHKFRRTFATRLAERGVEIQKIRVFLGHSSIQTTLMYIYTDGLALADDYKKAGL